MCECAWQLTCDGLNADVGVVYAGVGVEPSDVVEQGRVRVKEVRLGDKDGHVGGVHGREVHQTVPGRGEEARVLVLAEELRGRQLVLVELNAVDRDVLGIPEVARPGVVGGREESKRWLDESLTDSRCLTDWQLNVYIRN